MKIAIQPVSIALFGSATHIDVSMSGDDLGTHAIFQFVLGRLVPSTTVTEKNGDTTITRNVAERFEYSPIASSVVIDGDDYQKWSGSNSDIPALIAPKLPADIKVA